LKLDDVRLFLENPARYALRKRLGIYDDRDEDPMDQEEEPFFCPYPADYDLLRGAVHRCLAAADATRADSRAWFDAAYANLGLRGHMPAGPYRDLDREALWKRIETALDGVETLFSDLADEHRPLAAAPTLVIGDGSDRGLTARMRGLPVERTRAPRLQIGERPLEVHGELPCLFRDASDGSCVAVVFMAGSFKARHLLPAFAAYAAALLTDGATGAWLRGNAFRIRYVGKKKNSDEYEHGSWAPFRLEPSQAEGWLRELAESMLEGTGFDALPFDAIHKLLAPQGRLADGIDYAETLRAELEDPDEPEWGAAAPPASETLLAPAVPDDAEAKIRARFGLFFNFKPAADHG
jgi:hypothetical protein